MQGHKIRHDSRNLQQKNIPRVTKEKKWKPPKDLDQKDVDMEKQIL